jgi:hypothetical protein
MNIMRGNLGMSRARLGDIERDRSLDVSCNEYVEFCLLELVQSSILDD